MTVPPRPLSIAPPLSTLSTFDAAGAAIVAYLDSIVPATAWAVSRVVDDKQIFLRTNTNGLGIDTGLVVGWNESLCHSMTEGEIPSVVEDLDGAGIPRIGVPGHDPVRSYIGVPIRRADGSLFGTMCGFGSRPISGPLPAGTTALLDLLSGLLTTVFETDHARAVAERAAELARREAETDPLTGLFNRRGWNRVLEPEDARWTRFADPGAVVVVDLDGMKQVNDRHGHAAGDLVIRRAAELLRSWAHESGVVARLGGDEFGVLVFDRDATDVDDMLTALESSAYAAEVPMSVGWSTVTEAGSITASWSLADENMYVSKRRSSSRSGVDIHPTPGRHQGGHVARR
ncbi:MULTISPECIES: GGDEF domain-containing protein [Nocardiaceae]|uniref:Diguanylate cyclase (GGDEF)-like protein n=1 Tax=Rhodococcoides corynebacterioides TaxID=53972 RepID=A0ABS2KWU7_9NOCA|nr:MULTISPECIES: GGDEF domain-containing protein [Rhodococcus]MBM7416271.1 diguanylate cyclase (GGDEF)-like protein [Rhodococcus corynebacterioides]MBP1114524.1 diguanylate cyclase (GGDEF)-like protein [Rhodococcus sp. PvP016]